MASTIEEALTAHATTRLQADERVLYVGTARFELGRGWMIAMGVGFVLGILPGVLIGIMAIAHSRESPYIVATTRRLLTYMGRPSFGIILPRKVIDLGTVRSVEVKAVDGGSSVALAHADGTKTVLTLVPRGATRGLQASSAGVFHDEFPRWLTQNVSSSGTQVPAAIGHGAPAAPDPADKRRKLILGVGVGVAVVTCAVIYLVVAAVYRRVEANEYLEAEDAREAQRIARFRALGADAGAQAFFAALPSPGFRPTLAFETVPPSYAEIAALDAAHAALPAPPGGRSGYELRSGYDVGDFHDGSRGTERLEAILAEALGESPQAMPIDVVTPSPTAGHNGQLTVELHVRPVAGRAHPLRGGNSCIFIEATLDIRAETNGVPTWQQRVDIPAMSSEALAGNYSMRDGGSPRDCASAQAGDLSRRVVDTVAVALLGP